jgi:hypothetical protein
MKMEQIMAWQQSRVFAFQSLGAGWESEVEAWPLFPTINILGLQC